MLRYINEDSAQQTQIHTNRKINYLIINIHMHGMETIIVLSPKWISLFEPTGKRP